MDKPNLKVHTSSLSESISTQLPDRAKKGNKEQSIVDTCWSEIAVKDKLRNKFTKRTERNKKFNPQFTQPAKISLTPSNKKAPKISIVMIKETTKPSIFKHRNSLLADNLKKMRSINEGKNISSHRRNITKTFFEEEKKYEYSNLKEQLQKITFDLDNALGEVQPQKTRRTRKERKLNTMNTSRNSKLIQDNFSFDIELPKKRQTIGEVKSKLQANLKENSRVIGKTGVKDKLNKIVPVHRKCFTRMIQPNGKEEKKTQLINKNKRNMVSDIKKSVNNPSHKKIILNNINKPY